jgi:outer membrane protein
MLAPPYREESMVRDLVSRMIRSTCVLVIFLGSISAAIGQTAPAASSPKPISLLVLDFDKVTAYSKAGRSAKEQLNKKAQEYQKQFDKEMTELRREADQLNQQIGSATLSREIAIKKDKELQQKRDNFLEKRRAIDSMLTNSGDEALRQIHSAIMTITQKIAKDRKSNLVLLSTAVVLYDPTFDITDEVLQKLDEELPTLTVNFVAPVTTDVPAQAAASPVRPTKRRRNQ